MMTLYYREDVITRPQLLGLIPRFCFDGLTTIGFGSGILYIRRQTITWTNYSVNLIYRNKFHWNQKKSKVAFIF